VVVKKIILIAVNALCLIAFIVCLINSASLRTSLRSQQAVNTWSGQSGERFAQLSVFFPETVVFNEDRIRSLRASIDKALLSASLESRPDRTLYTDAWSAVGDVSIRGQHGSASAKAICVGGDFFMFHPLYLRDGTYISPNDVMKDRVVLDEELAWRLFGSVRLAGFEVMINNRPFKIAGVVSRESDFASSKAYTYGAGLFMSFEALSEMTEDGANISCYEIVMPDPITGFAKHILTEAFPDSGVHIVENTSRFSIGNSFAVIRSFGERSMRTDAISFPYWENAARIVEDRLALLLVLTLLSIAFPLVCAVIYTVKIIRYTIKFGRKKVTRMIDDIDKRKYEKYLIEHEQDVDIDIYNVNDIIREVQDENNQAGSTS